MLIKFFWIDSINFFKLLACLINPMDNVIAFMKKNAIRPLELLRSFDKENNWTLTKGAFAAHLKVSDKIFSVFLSVDLYTFQSVCFRGCLCRYICVRLSLNFSNMLQRTFVKINMTYIIKADYMIDFFTKSVCDFYSCFLFPYHYFFYFLFINAYEEFMT